MGSVNPLSNIPPSSSSPIENKPAEEAVESKQSEQKPETVEKSEGSERRERTTARRLKQMGATVSAHQQSIDAYAQQFEAYVPAPKVQLPKEAAGSKLGTDRQLVNFRDKCLTNENFKNLWTSVTAQSTTVKQNVEQSAKRLTQSIQDRRGEIEFIVKKKWGYTFYMFAPQGAKDEMKKLWEAYKNSDYKNHPFVQQYNKNKESFDQIEIKSTSDFAAFFKANPSLLKESGYKTAEEAAVALAKLGSVEVRAEIQKADAKIKSELAKPPPT